MGTYMEDIKTHLEHAVTDLRTAKALLETGQDGAVASRASDSAFHVASALLLDEDIEPEKHGDVITLIQQIFVQGRQLTKEQGGDLSWLFALKNAEDRAPSMAVTAKESHRAVQIAESFFEAAKVILEA